MRPLRVLLVEDDAVIGALIADVIGKLGYEVCGIARTELEAIDAAALHAPGLMLVDAHLRSGDGVSAMAAILRRTAMPHIFMTGGSRRIIPAHATVLHKPFSTAALQAALQSVAGQLAP